MLRWPLLLLLGVLVPLQPLKVTGGPAYTADGRLLYPADYAEWTFLGTGLDMSYTSEAPVLNGAETHSTFNSVFVNPSAYKAFKQTGLWPEGTMMVLENRAAEGHASINKRGKTESSEVTGMEVHVKDGAHLKGGWGFFAFDDKVSGKLIERPASCYKCHEEHAAVDTTFTQFYPKAFEIAKQKGTLSKEFLKDEGAK